MNKYTLYTAVGHFQRKSTAHGSYPVIIIDQQEYMVDIQEMILWTCLNWRFLTLEQLQRHYEQKVQGLDAAPSRPLEACVARLVTRGLAASGTGDTGLDALYDLLGGLYVVPVSSSVLLRVCVFLKLTLRDHIPIYKAGRLFRTDRPSPEERRVLELSKQALLSTAELIKCVETQTYDVSTCDKLLTALYDDTETTSRNISFLMRDKPSTVPVLTAISNLYLRQQIIFQRL